MDHILLNELQFYGYHGVYQEEQQKGQAFVVSVELGLSLAQAGHSDDLSDTVSYAEVYQVIRQVMEQERYDLLETAAQQIQQRIFTSFAMVQTISITVLKPNAPVEGSFTSMGIRIFRERNDHGADLS